MIENPETQMRKTNRHKTRPAIIFISGIVIGVLMSFGVKLFGSNVYGLSFKDYVDITSFIDMTEKYYYKDTKDVDYSVGIKKGIVNSLGDPYSRFLTKEEFDSMMEDTLGEFVGIGVYVAPTKEGKIGIVAPIKDSPAQKAGIESGDIILTVNGIAYDATTMDEAVRNMKGKAGEKVTIELLSLKKQIKKVTITKSPIHPQTVDSKMLEDGIGYLQIISFENRTSQEFKDNIKELQKEDMKGLILDLRSNPGGMVDQVLDISDEILGESKIVYTKNKDGIQEQYVSDEQHKIDIPMVVLVDKGSASASEILAGSLKDNGKATIVGTNTYGKGVIQSVMGLNDGTGLVITTAEYFTPKGNRVHEVGIKPDVQVEYDPNLGMDNQLQKAIEVLKSKI